MKPKPIHSPAPWTVGAPMEIWDADRRTIATTVGLDDIDEDVSNCVVMTLGPEMLEALRSAANYLSGYGGATKAQILHEIRAIMAKAQGR